MSEDKIIKLKAKLTEKLGSPVYIHFIPDTYMYEISVVGGAHEQIHLCIHAETVAAFSINDLSDYFGAQFLNFKFEPQTTYGKNALSSSGADSSETWFGLGETGVDMWGLKDVSMWGSTSSQPANVSVHPSDELYDKFNWRQKALCPECLTSKKHPLWTLVIHMNDQHRMTREQIARWLEESDLDINLKG